MGEPVPGELHPVAGVSGEPDDHAVELVDLLIQELQSNRNIWSPYKRAAQDELNGQLFDHLMRLRPPLVDADKAGILTDRLMEQARANHDKLVQV